MKNLQTNSTDVILAAVKQLDTYHFLGGILKGGNLKENSNLDFTQQEHGLRPPLT
jgi:hypothetical protein